MSRYNEIYGEVTDYLCGAPDAYEAFGSCDERNFREVAENWRQRVAECATRGDLTLDAQLMSGVTLALSGLELDEAREELLYVASIAMRMVAKIDQQMDDADDRVVQLFEVSK